MRRRREYHHQPVWDVTVREREHLTDAELAEQRELGLRSWAASAEPDGRYPFGVTWAPPTWLALVRTAEGRLIGRAGVLVRDVTWAGAPLTVGGVSSVSTDPEFWGQGVARAAVSRIMQFLCAELGAHAGLLIASEMGRPVYERLGWRVVRAPLVCAQPAGPLEWNAEFPSKLPMVWTCAGQSLPDGPIDLNGPPW